MNSEPVKAWHFLPSDRRLGYGDGRKVIKGRTVTVNGKPVMCRNGLHGSIRIIDALRYSRGPFICRVEIGGDVIHDTDKLCGTSRKCLWWLDGTNILHEFACRVAEQALEDAQVTDERLWAAITAKRRWLKGEITDDQLAAAREAAWYAARDAAWYAAWCAACDAARNAQNQLLEDMVCRARHAS